MKKKQKIEIIAILVLGLFFLVLLLKMPSGKKAVTSAAKAGGVSAKAGPGGRDGYKDEKRAAVEPSGKKERLPLRWGRDPFTLTESRGTEAWAPIEIDGIIKHGKTYRALISDEIHGAGDKIGNVEIIRIEKDKVVIKEGDKVQEVIFEPILNE